LSTLQRFTFIVLYSIIRPPHNESRTGGGRDFGGIGYIKLQPSNRAASFVVTKLEDLVNIIIPHFDTYYLRSEKGRDYFIWKTCIKLIENKAH